MAQLQTREKRLLWILLVVLCIVLPFRYIYMPFTARVAAKKELLASETAKLRRMELTLAKAQQVRNEYVEALEALAARERRLLPEYELPYIMRELDRLARREGIYLSTINPSTAASSEGVSRIHLAMTVSGGYEDIANYLQQLKGLPFPVAVLQVSLKTGRPGSSESEAGALAAGLELAVWVREQGGVRFGG